MSPQLRDQFQNHHSQESQEDKDKLKDRYLDICMAEIKDKSSMLGAPRQIPKKSYSLAPDMATGWKPKRKNNINYKNVFPLNFKSEILDQLVKTLSRKYKNKYNLSYLGPRKHNSYNLHETHEYQNPYPLQKRIDCFLPERPGVNLNSLTFNDYPLKFNSNFEGGNLDIAVKMVSESSTQKYSVEYDLFMRVDSNTKGHTNWFYFEVIPQQQWVGSVRFNICNFRRPKSLYQRGMKPYVQSKNADRNSEELNSSWSQGGRQIIYQRKSLRYKFMYDQDDQNTNSILSTYYTMSFTYDFNIPNDKVRFAYCIPYTYTQCLRLIREVNGFPFVKFQTAWRSLSGLSVPLIQITNFDEPEYNKKIILVTARIHPGQSNSSFVCQGLIKYLCFNQKNQDILKKAHFYIIPMLNPDGVVAGNYRTSLFGRDLNRTFNQSRKYAFPETFHLVEFVTKLKKQQKQRFNIYLDLHGHSVKKNIFFYGPDYNLAHAFYNQCRDFPKILGNLTHMFRYYSCIFRITSEKVTTARATFNRSIGIPFTFTLQSSNGGYYDSSEHEQKNFTAKKWAEMGKFLVKGLDIWLDRLNKNNCVSMMSKNSKFINESDDDEKDENDLTKKQPPGKQKQSDDEISEGKSDSEPSGEDLNDEELKQLQKQIEGRVKTEQKETKTPYIRNLSPEKSFRIKQKKSQIDWSRDLRQSSSPPPLRKERLPPINLQINPIQFRANPSSKKRMMISEALSNLSSSQIKPNLSEKAHKKVSNNRITISQMLLQPSKDKKFFKIEQKNLIVSKQKRSRQQFEYSRKNW